MKFNPTIVILLFATILPILFVDAQDQPQQTVSLTLVALPLVDDRVNAGAERNIFDNVSFFDGKSLQRIGYVPYLGRSVNFEHKGNAPLILFSQKNNESPSELLRINLPEDLREAVIFLRQDPESSRNLLHYTLDARSLPRNEEAFRLFNFSGQQIGCLLGNQQFQIAQHSRLDAQLQGKPRMITLRLATTDHAGFQWEPVLNTSLPFRGGHQIICLILDDGHNNAPAVYIINDLVTPEGFPSVSRK